MPGVDLKLDPPSPRGISKIMPAQEKTNGFLLERGLGGPPSPRKIGYVVAQNSILGYFKAKIHHLAQLDAPPA